MTGKGQRGRSDETVLRPRSGYLLLVTSYSVFHNFLAMTTRTRSDFTLQEAQHAMGVTPAHLERMIDEGKVKVVSDGVQTWVPRQSILDYFAEAVTKKKKS